MLDTLEVNADIREGISFFSQEQELSCPCCGEIVQQEVMRTGAGRLDAGELQVDLHRNYVPTKEHGEVYPLLYLISICSHCNFAAFKFDFKKLHKKTLESIKTKTAIDNRTQLVLSLFSQVPDFTQKRDLKMGVAAYLLAISTYEYFDERNCPTIRMAICALRAAWLCRHIQEKSDAKEEMDMLISLMYRKAFFLYDKAFELSIQGKEDPTNIPALGPDFDKDYGYDGVIYMHAWLYVNYDIKIDNGITYKYETLKRLRTNLSKVFGFGKATRAKPSALMDMARITYDQVQEELEKAEAEFNARMKAASQQ